MCESRDFVNWSEPRLILAPDPDLDNLDVAFYGMRPFRLGGHWIGFLGRVPPGFQHLDRGS